MNSPYNHPKGFTPESTIWARGLVPPTHHVHAATTATIADLDAATVVHDGVTLTAGKLLLVKNQSDTTKNGIYAVGTVTSAIAKLWRVPWFSADTQDIVPGTLIYVAAGTANGGEYWYVTNTGTITIGTTNITFSQLVGSIPAELSSTANGEGASGVGIEDAAALFTATTVEGALEELAVVQDQVDVPLTSFVDPDGDPLVRFADGASAVPGWNLADSEAFGIRWNNHATPNLILTQVTMPQDLDDAAAVVLHILASKTGATVGDAVTFTCTAFFHTVGALHDADLNAGGVSSAMTGNATAKTVQELTLSIAAGDVPPSPSSLSLTIKPTDGTLGTDDVIVEAVWLEYTKKLLTA